MMLKTDICVVDNSVENNELTTYEQLLYDLLFGKSNVQHIKFDDFCEFDERLKFKDEIRDICKKGKVKILDDRIIHTEDYIIWKLEVKRL